MGKKITNDDYKKTVTFLKMAVTFAAGAGLGSAAIYGTPILNALPDNYENMDQLVTVLVTAAIPAVLRGARNWWKHSGAKTFNATFGLMLAAMLIPAFALGGCNGGEFQRTTVTTVEYIGEDGFPRTETISTTEFDQKAYEAAIDAANQLAELAAVLRKPQEKTPEEIEAARQEYEIKRAFLEAIIERVRNGNVATN